MTIIKKAVISEKSEIVKANNNEYVFIVDRRSNKIEIAKAIKNLYNVDVVKVRTTIKKPVLKIVRGVKTFTKLTKKAYVRLADGNSINI